MDAMKLLSGLLGNKSLSSGLGSQLLQGVLGGGGSGQQSGASSGGISSLIGGLLGGNSAGGGTGDMVGGLLKSVMGGGAPAAQVETQTPNISQNEEAILMIRAMINAAKSDGRIDQSEKENIVNKLGDLDQSEIDFLNREFATTLDVDDFARSIPQGLEQQIYAVSLTAIDLDSQNEAKYLGQLAQALNMNPAICNQIHDKLGAPKIFG